MDFLAIDIILERVRGNNVDFPTIEMTSKKVHGNNVHSLAIDITLKKFTKMMGNLSKFGI